MSDDPDGSDQSPGDGRYRVADVEAAIALAQQFKDEGRYQWFRGQVQAWPPHSTLYRRAMSGGQRWFDAEYRPQLNRFLQWLRTTPALGPLAADLDQAFAVAQHHGLPTHCIDFTTDPAVAGFFSADSAEPPPAGSLCCLYCLDLEDLREVWSVVSQARVETGDSALPPLNFLTPQVPNLWRLEAQCGVFLECSGNWDAVYPMDRIEFPYTGPPAYPPREVIYPARRSQLEQLLDQFFDNENKLAAEVHMAQMAADLRRAGANVGVIAVNRDRPLFHAQAFRAGVIEPHPSWSAREPWLALKHEPLAQVQDRRIALALDFRQDPPTLRRRALAGIEQALKRQPDARAHAVHWEVSESAQVAGAALPPSLNQGLARLWDGMRNQPFSDAQLARAMATWVALAAAGYAEAGPPQRQAMVEQLFGGPAVTLEFGAHDGASSRGVATESALRAALRPDLDQLLTEEARAQAESIRLLLQMCFAVERLFVFEPLLELFVDQIAPTQLHRSPPSFFHPARLRILGLP